MDKKVLYRLVEEVRQQCRFAQAALQSLRSRVNQQDPDRVFLDVHAFLGHATMISRLLWPTRARSAERGALLRQELKIPESSGLRLSGIRDQVEGLDEAYEDWLMTLPEAGSVDMNLMPTGTLAGSRSDIFQRSLDPDTLVVQLRGAPLDLRRTGEAIRALDAGAAQWLRTHQPW